MWPGVSEGCDDKFPLLSAQTFFSWKMKSAIQAACTRQRGLDSSVVTPTCTEAHDELTAPPHSASEREREREGDDGKVYDDMLV
ncbi:hypothetical protein B296_00035853 [Ensete ventricosum]|uniref:Uncharacterized protein n=1 Tax=Ensete ventricosum TaxID=4639 RepID=A0A426Z021_ENSVE|nr:hypothetical protein B296_00035853 [Ensete ventricosum]